MNAKDLSIVIPSRNEMFLAKTIENILENIEADTEVNVVLDGQWSDPPISQHERVNVIYVNKSIGQRAGQNLAVRLSKAKFVMKVDAHCAFDKGFDRKMIEGFKDKEDCVMVPVMRNLHAFNWKCSCGWSKYQGPTPEKCPTCGLKPEREMLWKPRRGTHSVSYCFDKEPHFQYFGEWTNTETYKEQLKTGFTETMSLQGSCFMSTRENYWNYELCDETLGNWGNQGMEIALATWLTGHRVLVNHNTWYAHMFRTQGGDFGFPWQAGGRDIQKTKDNVRDKYWNFKHSKQIYPVDWLVKRFAPVKGW